MITITSCYHFPLLYEVNNSLVSKEKKLWELPEWKATRKRLLKSHCEQCGNKDKVLVLTHTKTMPSAKSVGRKIRQQMLEELIAKGGIEEFSLSDEEKSRFQIETCPSCSSSSLRIRKVKSPKYACNNCKGEFENANTVINWNDYDLLRLRNEYNWQQLEPHRDEIDNRYQAEMEANKEWYLSGNDTWTLCNSCSFNFKKGRILCETCRKHYHSKRYEGCFHCNSVLCTKCKETRILKKLGVNTCEECTESKICEICKENKLTGDLNLCESCVLQGHWLDD